VACAVVTASVTQVRVPLIRGESGGIDARNSELGRHMQIIFDIVRSNLLRSRGVRF
jgi:hypothetical protein